jgi:single-strand DNA-binding protein
MSARSLNKVQLIGNLTRDPELRYTPTGAAVCTIGLATNRSWVMESGEKKEETEFHRVVAWNKLAELCSQLLAKGRKIYVEGRLRTNQWQGQDGTQRYTTEVVIEDMIILDSRRPVVPGEDAGGEHGASDTKTTVAQPQPTQGTGDDQKQSTDKPEEKPLNSASPDNAQDKRDKPAVSEDINPDDIPF